jgi:hypothetical protein
MRVLKAIKFVYCLFIGIQLLVLGYGELCRMKNLVNFVISNSKKIRIQSGGGQEAQPPAG